MLKRTLEAMDPKDASMYLKKCIDSGLWVENANAAEGEGEGQIEELKTDDEEETGEGDKRETKASPAKPNNVAAATTSSA